MKTKVPFAGRALILTCVAVSISCFVATKLVKLHITPEVAASRTAADELIDRERIPAQRGVIMDRNEELLTNNIQSSALIADRYHLREITAVVEGLAYNHAIHDPRWDTITDTAERRKLIYNYRAKLLNNAKADMTDEEKKARMAKTDRKDAKANRLREFDEKMMEYYFQQHDKLVAEVLYPFLCHQEIEETINGRTIKRFMTRAGTPSPTIRNAAAWSIITARSSSTTPRPI